MSGTRTGGLRAVQTNKERYGDDWYSSIGFKGGSGHRPETRWFHKHPEMAKKYGKIGGMKSKRTRKELQ